jgi:hypothetical protein
MVSPFQRVQTAMKETSRQIDRLVAAMEELEDKKARIEGVLEELGGAGTSDTQLALMNSAYDQLRIRDLRATPS